VCRECKRAYERNQHAQKPELTAARREKYKDRLDSAPGSFSDYDIAMIRRQLNDCCFYCGVPLKGGGEKDHIVPLSKDGTNWPSNITLACLRCNRDKYDKSVSEFVVWRKERGLLTSAKCLQYLAAQKLIKK
jgi:5-methylcytosine-specific restriction endonuclease McrA